MSKQKKEQTSYTLGELNALAGEYLAGLDDSYQEELYTTDRSFAVIGATGFLAWLKKRERRIAREAKAAKLKV